MMTRLGRFASHVQSHNPEVRKSLPVQGVKNVPAKPVSGKLSARRLRNKNKDYTTTYYVKRKKAGVSLDRIVQHLVESGRLKANPLTGIVYRRRKSTCQWKQIAVDIDRNGRQCARLYATLNGVPVRVGTTLAKIAYLIYHGCGSIPPHHDIDHDDDDRENNRLDNLVPLWYNVNRSRCKPTTPTLPEGLQTDELPF